jgi:hypothetical protein
MIFLGVILLLIGYFTGLSILYTFGGILVVIGVVLDTRRSRSPGRRPKSLVLNSRTISGLNAQCGVDAYACICGSLVA